MGDIATRIEDAVVAVNNLLRKKGGAGLEVRAIRDEGRGRMWVRTDQVDTDGTRHKRQESQELTPEQALAYLQNMLSSLGRA